MNTWYVLDESSGAQTPIGPFTLEQISQMVSAGSLHARSRVAPIGSSQWGEAASDPVLATLFGTRPPTSPDAVAPVSASAAIRPYSFGAALSLGYASFKARWSAWMLLSLGMIGISVVIALPQVVMNNLGQSAMRAGDRGSGILLVVGGLLSAAVLQIFVGMPLFAGWTYAAAKIHAGEPQLADLFAGFRRYGAALGSGLLLLLIYLAVVVAAYIMIGFVAVGIAVSAGSEVTAIVGLLAVVVVSIGLARVVMRVLFAPVIAIDPAFGNPGVMRAFRISWANSEGVGPSMLGLLVVGGLLAAASILLLCVGYIFVGIPLFASIHGAMYVMVHRNRATSQLPSP